jgi:hypothetical protein
VAEIEQVVGEATEPPVVDEVYVTTTLPLASVVPKFELNVPQAPVALGVSVNIT